MSKKKFVPERGIVSVEGRIGERHPCQPGRLGSKNESKEIGLQQEAHAGHR